jgi:hypothetical protein
MRAIAIAAVIPLLAACGSGGGGTSATLVSVAVTPATVRIAAGATRQLTATASYSDGSSADVTGTATWRSYDTATATVGATGLATGVAAGSATVTATRDGISGVAQVTVTSGSATLVALTVTPANGSLPVGATRQFTATGAWSDGSTSDETTSSAWTSSSPGTASIGASTGLATGLALGTTTITATQGAVSGHTLLTVAGASPLDAVDLLFSNGADLCGMRVDGTGARVLKPAFQFDAWDSFRSMSFSGDGSRIAYEATCGGAPFLRVMGAGLGDPVDVTPRCAGKAASSPAFSPDGSRIAFIASNWATDERGDYLYVMNADGTAARRLTPLDGPYDPAETSPAFSRDGSRIVFTTSRGGATWLAVVGVDGTGMSIFDGGTAGTDPVPFTPTVDWRTDTVYYTSARTTVLSNQPNVYTIGLSGAGKAGPLTSSSSYPLYDPSVSPDGTQVVFTQVQGFSAASLQVLDLATARVTTLANPSFAPYCETPVFVRRASAP